MICCIQARSTSTRLPNKCLKDLLGKPLWKWSYDVASTVLPTYVIVPPDDKPMIESCRKYAVNWYAPSCDVNNVLSRYVMTSDRFQRQSVMRITSDCPVIPRIIISDMMHAFRRCDYVSNVNVYSWVDGWDVQCCSHRLLKYLDIVVKPPDREHVFSYVEGHYAELIEKGFVVTKRNYEWLTEWFPKLSIDCQEDWVNVESYIKKMMGVS